MKRWGIFSRRIALIVLAAAYSHAVASQAHTGGFSVKGEIAGVSSGQVKLLSYNGQDRTLTVLDSGGFSHTAFELKGTFPVPQMLTLVVEPGGWSIPVFMENSFITVKADTIGARPYDHRAYGGGAGMQVKHFMVSGSENNDDYRTFQEAPGNKRIDEAFADLNSRYTAETDPAKKGHIRALFDSVITLQTAWQQRWIDSFISAKPVSVAGAYLLNNFYSLNPGTSTKTMDTLLKRFRAPATSSVYFTGLSKALTGHKALLPGNTAPDFTLLKRDSSSLSLSSTRGKYTMIDFWASWCSPCRNAIPRWKEVYQKYHDKGFEIISVADDHRRGDWIKAMDEEKIPWAQVIDEFPGKNMPAMTLGVYMVQYIPFYVLVDREGRIVLYTNDEEQIDRKLAELLR